jgi:hypothetical protein
MAKRRSRDTALESAQDEGTMSRTEVEQTLQWSEPFWRASHHRNAQIQAERTHAYTRVSKSGDSE